MIKCEKCKHKEICGKKEEYIKTYKKLNADLNGFELELNCNHCESEINLLNKYASSQLQSQSIKVPYNGINW